MSELIANTKEKNLRWQLLTTASAASLLVAAAGPASAQDAGRPTVWIELGAQLEGMRSAEDQYAPPFILNNLNQHLDPGLPLTVKQPDHSSFGGEGRVLFQPAGTDLLFSAAVRYGRSNGKRSAHQQTHSQFTVHTLKYAQNHGHGTVTKTRFNDAKIYYSTEHAVVDFAAGKDVGLGMFGRGSSSVFSVGVRIAQFTENSNPTFRSIPYHNVNPTNFADFHYSYYAKAHFERSFHGIGPTISWEASAPLLGHREAGEVTLDWGANAAALFGRQKVQGSHETTSLYFGLRSAGAGTAPIHIIHTQPVGRSRSVVVPNVGGFAGLSVRYPNVKFSVGYRADFFLGAMDGGVDTRHSLTQGFNGPFATFSIGLGG